MIMKYSESFQVPYEATIQRDENGDETNPEIEAMISPYQHIFDFIVSRVF